MTAKRIRIDKELWAPKSRGGLDEYFAGEFYEDKSFMCRTCGKPGVFTAEQQKYTYEVKKAPIYQEHVLCEACFDERMRLEHAADAFLDVWNQNKAALLANISELRRWKELLEQLPKYGAAQDTARIQMITKLLEKVS